MDNFVSKKDTSENKEKRKKVRQSYLEEQKKYYQEKLEEKEKRDSSGDVPFFVLFFYLYLDYFSFY